MEEFECAYRVDVGMRETLMVNTLSFGSNAQVD